MHYRLHKVKKQWVILPTLIASLSFMGMGGLPSHMVNAKVINLADSSTPQVFQHLTQYYDKVDKHHQVNPHHVTLLHRVKTLPVHRILTVNDLKVQSHTTYFKYHGKTFTTNNANILPAMYTHGELQRLSHGHYKNLVVMPNRQLFIHKRISFKGMKIKIMRQNGFQIRALRYYHGVPRFELTGGGYLTADRNLVQVFNVKTARQSTHHRTKSSHYHADTSSATSSQITPSSNAINSSQATDGVHNLTAFSSNATPKRGSNSLSSGVTNSSNAASTLGASLQPVGNGIAPNSQSSLGSTATSSSSVPTTTSSSSDATINTSSSDATTNTLATDNTAFSISNATLDKARYNPNEMVKLNYTVDATNPTNDKSTTQVKIYQENKLVDTLPTTSLSNQGSTHINYQWTPPSTDFTGYRAEISIDGVVKKVIAIDVSSNSDKFPRYGAITEFTPNMDNTQVLQQMKNLGITNLEYYDAYQNPQNPMNLDDLNGNYVQDWAPWLSDADKIKSGKVIKQTVDSAHQYNMESMLYNMIYAITGNAKDPAYLKSIGVKPEWLLYHADGNDKDKLFQFHMAGYLPTSDPNYDKATQTYLDIKNPEVVDWMVSRMRPILEKMDFDGWHGDTIGDNSLMYSKNADGSIKNEYHVDDELGNFANMVKQRLGDKKFAINTVAGAGEDNVAASKTNFDYSETWSGTYFDVVNEIKRIANESNKSLVIPGYLQEGLSKTKPGSDFNTNAVLLFDAMVNSAGGSRMEIVDGNHLLVGEFFPSKALTVPDSLLTQLQSYQTFLTAYENLLRDGQRDNQNDVTVYNNQNQSVSSNNASPNSVYAYSRSSKESETIQLINMLGVTSDKWQDDDSSRQQPQTLNDFHVKYRPSADYQPGGSKTVHQVYLASPDGDKANQSIAVPFKWEHDNQGDYLNITVPQLQRWDMLYLK